MIVQVKFVKYVEVIIKFNLMKRVKDFYVKNIENKYMKLEIHIELDSMEMILISMKLIKL